MAMPHFLVSLLQALVSDNIVRKLYFVRLQSIGVASLTAQASNPDANITLIPFPNQFYFN